MYVMLKTISSYSVVIALGKKLHKDDETLFPVLPTDIDIKDIQEYKNFSHLDATLYGIFACSNAFDNLLLEEVAADTNAEEIYLQKLLKCEIIDLFRKYVRHTYIYT